MSKFYISVFDAPSGNVRRARGETGRNLKATDMASAVKTVAKWQAVQAEKRANGEAVRHTYSVRSVDAEDVCADSAVLVCL